MTFGTTLVAHAVAFHHHYIPTDPVQRCILPITFLITVAQYLHHECLHYLAMYLLMCVILALTASLFLTNACHVLESMALRTGKERSDDQNVLL